MSLSLRKLHPLFAAEVTGVDLREAKDEATLREIRAALDEHAVLAFPDQPLSDDEQAAFTERLGGQEFTGMEGAASPGNDAHRGVMAIERLSNVSESNGTMSADDKRRISKLGNRIWHTDGSQFDPSVRYTLLSGRKIPPVRADTEFADTRAAYDALDDEMKAFLEGKHAFHSVVYSRGLLGFSFSKDEEARLKGAVHPVARTVPGSDRKALYLGAHASHIVELLLPEGRLLLRDLTEHATSDRFVYRHDWRLNDLLIWDNRTTLHRARPFDDSKYQRDMRRTRTVDWVAGQQHQPAA